MTEQDQALKFLTTALDEGTGDQVRRLAAVAAANRAIGEDLPAVVEGFEKALRQCLEVRGALQEVVNRVVSIAIGEKQ